MDFGIFMDFYSTQGLTQNEVFKQAFELVDLAEETGLDSVWLGESHFNPNRSVLSAPIVVASSIAARTKRLKVGMAVQVLPLISPLRIAEEAATVDQISEGRFEFGVGRSGNQRAYEIMGIPYDESRERFQEALDIILEAWKGETFSYHGKFNHIENATLSHIQRTIAVVVQAIADLGARRTLGAGVRHQPGHTLGHPTRCALPEAT